MDKYKEVVEALIRFRDERDWAQFHDSKNLALALLLEASELNELFLWKKEGNYIHLYSITLVKGCKRILY